MKKLFVWLSSLGTFSTLPAVAQVGQIGMDGYYYITEGISPRTRYRVELSETPTTRAIRANACGLLLIRPGQQPFCEGEHFEVTDSATQQTYSFTNSSLPVKTSPQCRNGQLETSDIPPVWKTSEGAIAVRGLTPESAMTLRMLDRNAKRTVMSNSCGFLRVKLPSPNLAAIATAKTIRTYNEGVIVTCYRLLCHA